MTSSHTVISLAGALARATGQAFVILETHSTGGDSLLDHAHPSLDEHQVDILSAGPLILSYPDDAAAQKAFNAFTQEAGTGYRTSLGAVDTAVIYVGRVGGMLMTTCNPSHAFGTVTQHVFVDGTIHSPSGLPDALMPQRVVGMPEGFGGPGIGKSVVLEG